MARSPKQLVEETKRTLTRLEQELQSALAVREQYNKDLRNARARLSRKEKSPYPDNLVNKFIIDTKKGNVLSSTLISEIDSAIITNREFERSPYREALYSVAQDQDIYKFIRNGNGWNTDLKVEIVFEESAGRLNDWARGISYYREEILGTERLDSEKAGKRATNFWFTKVYRKGLEIKTIAGRIDAANRPAPFWQILNNGSSPLPSDRPGGSNPVPSTPTDFIGKAERSIERNFLFMFVTEKARWYEEEALLRQHIRLLQETRDEYSEEVRNLRTEEKINEKIYQSFGEKKQFINRNKLEDIVKRLRAGQEFDKPTVDLSKPGSSKLRRISIRKLEGFIEY